MNEEYIVAKGYTNPEIICPKCNTVMIATYNWIEHDGWGHPGSILYWECPNCRTRINRQQECERTFERR